MSNIENLQGAISFTNGIKTALEEELAHTETSKMQVSRSADRLRIVATYLEELSGTMVAHGMSNKREQTAAMSAIQVALSIQGVNEKVSEMQEEFKALLVLIDIVLEQIHTISESP